MEVPRVRDRFRYSGESENLVVVSPKDVMDHNPRGMINIQTAFLDYLKRIPNECH